jgi:HEAT repeat protein
MRTLAIKNAGKMMLSEAVSPLIEALYDPDPAISSLAAESLGKIGDPRAIEPLLEVSRNVDRTLMEDHLEGGGGSQGSPSEFNEGRTNVPLTEEKPPDTNPFKYKELTLFRIDLLPKEYFQSDGTPIPRKDLVLRGLKDNDQQLRKIAAKTAIGMNDPELIQSLVETLKNPYEVESVRYLAAEALGGMQTDSSTDALVASLQDETVAVRYSAASALSKIGGKKAVDALVTALADPNEFVRSSVAYALGQIGDQNAMNALFGAISDENEVVRFSAAKALGSIGGEQVLSGLEDRMKEHNARIKTAAIEVLGQMKDERAIQLLRDALRDENSEVAFRASLALMNQDSLEALEDLISASKRLDDELMEWVSRGEKPEPREVRVPEPPPEPIAEEVPKNAPRSRREDEALEKLSSALKHTSPNVRGSAAINLGEYKTPQAQELLLVALRDSHEYVRSSAVASLGKIGDPAVLAPLIELVHDTSEEVRYSLAKVFAGFNDKRAQFQLNVMAENDPAKDVKRMAKKELERLKQSSGPGA